MGIKNHKHIAVAGPTSVGKGYTGNQIIEAFGEDRIWMIVLGKLIVARMRNDVGFSEQYGETVLRGGLLPYEAVTPMVESRYQEGIDAGYEIFFWDGYPRDRKQAERLLEIWGVPGIGYTNYRIFMLQASKKTCRSRLDEAIASRRRLDRGDNHVFDDRYDLHEKNEPEVIRTIEEYGGYVKPVDANMPLERVAKTVIMSCRLLLPFKQSGFKHEPPVTTGTESSRQSLVAA